MMSRSLKANSSNPATRSIPRRRVLDIIERMRNAAHSVLERRARVFLPRIAMAATRIDIVFAQIVDELDGARHLRSEGHSLDRVAIFKQWRISLARWLANQRHSLRPRFRPRNKRPFHMHAGEDRKSVV